MHIYDARAATIKRFTNLFDGSIIPSASVSQILDYYEAKLKNAHITVKDNCNITSCFLEEELHEYEEEYHDQL